MAEGLASLRVRRFEAPFQLWDDLGTPVLRDFHPIAQAAHEARYRRAQRREGIIPLSEFHEEPPRAR